MGGYIFVKSWPDDFCYGDSDVVLRFSNQPSGTLLLFSKTLRQHSRFFTAMFSTRWIRPLTAAGGADVINHFEADMLLDCEEGVTYLQTNVSHSGRLEKPC